MISLGYVVGRLMGWSPWVSLITGMIVSISGAVIAARAFDEVRIDPHVRRFVFGIVLCEDVLAILFLAMLITLANGGALSLGSLTIAAGLLSLFVVGMIALGLIIVPRGVARFKRQETLLITSLGLCFAFAMIAERLGYTVALGAFLAGTLVAESQRGEEVARLIEPVRHVFAAIFFVAVGMRIDPHLLQSNWEALTVLSVLTIAGKIVSVSVATIAVGERPDTAIKAGFPMAQIGVFAILFAQADDANAKFLYSLAVGLMTITTLLCPLIVRASTPMAAWIDNHLPLPMQNALAQYEAWLKRLRNGREPTVHAPPR
jgi:CPA2 family monovalent cation:H+ antiporter-2